jgi:hypothetical protein
LSKYFLTFSDASPPLQSELADDTDAVAFADFVAKEIGREKRTAPPSVMVKKAGVVVDSKDRPLTCKRCASAQRLSGIERHADELCFTFVCTDCRAVETRSVFPAPRMDGSPSLDKNPI